MDIKKLNCCVNNFIKFVKQPKEPSAIAGVALYTIFVMVLVASICAAKMSWGVFVGDKLIALAGSKEEARQVITRLAGENQDSEEATLMLGRVCLKKTMHKGDILSGKDLEQAIFAVLNSRTKGTEVLINGRTELVFKDRTEAEGFLASLKSAYDDCGGNSSFLEDIRLVDKVVDKDKIMTFSQAMEKVKNGSQYVTTYIVKDGDTIWDISLNLGVSVEKLIASNPGLDPDNIGLGDEIKLDRVDPLINVQTELTRVQTERIECVLENRKDSSLYFGEKKVIAEGKEGKKEVTYKISMINGVETSSQVLNEVILEPAEPRIVLSGSRMLLASRGGNGRLGWPADGSMVSAFGPRGGGWHSGVDISGGYGAPVVAAEAGTVTRASWYSGYGNCIDISHGDGVVTRYAHLSSYNVTVGQSVARGELIGRIGATGIATGPHLHFEVIVNGQAKDPLNFT